MRATVAKKKAVKPKRVPKASTEANPAKYERAVVTFVDILGFREIVKANGAAEISKLLELLRHTSGNTPLFEDPCVSFLAFSDSTIRVAFVDHPHNVKHRSGLLWYEVLHFMFAQAQMAYEGHLIRGGMSIGNISMSADRVFGPALVSAYTLESSFAVYPRIVIDPLVLDHFERDRLLRNHKHSLRDERGWLRTLIRQGDDGIYFIDYLKAFVEQYDDGAELGFIDKHRELVITRAQEHQSLTNVSAKILWLAKYHNAVVRELGNEWFEVRESRLDDFLVSSAECAMLYDK